MRTVHPGHGEDTGPIGVSPTSYVGERAYRHEIRRLIAALTEAAGELVEQRETD